MNNNRIQVLSPNGSFLSEIKEHNGVALEKPVAVSVDESGTVYIVEKERGGVKIIASDGSQSAVNVRSTSGTAVDRRGNLFVADPRNGVQVFKPDGELLMRFGSPGKSFGQFESPIDIDVTDAAEVLVADSKTNRISIFKLENYLTGAIAGSVNPLPESTKVEITENESLNIEKLLERPNSSFFISDLEPGLYQVTIDAPGHAKEMLTDLELKAGRLIDVGIVTLVEFGSLTGFIGPKDVSAKLSISDESGDIVKTKEMESGGDFKMEELRPGDYKLYVEADGFDSYKSDQSISVESGKESRLGEIVLQKFSAVTGIVFPGSSVANVFARQNGEVVDSTTINPYDGSFKLGRLASGAYSVSIVADGYHEFLEEKLELANGEEKSLGVIKLISEKRTSESAKSIINEGKLLHFQLEYRQALQKFQAALETNELGREDEIQVYIWIAYSLYPFPEELEKTKVALVEALKLSPTLELGILGDFPPDFVLVCEQLKSEVEKSGSDTLMEPSVQENETSDHARQLLEHGKELHLQFQFKEAQEKFREAILTNELNEDDLASTYVALAYSIFPDSGARDEVKVNLVKALRLRPGIQLGEIGTFSPEFVQIFEEANGELE